MAFATPQRPLPGAFFNTPAASRFGAPPAPIPIFRPSALSGRVQPQGTAQQPQNSQQPQPDPQSRQDAQLRALKPIQRAARTINEILQKEASFPDLDSYVRQGISSDYDLPNVQNEPSWAPFQKTRVHDIPERIFEQWNRAGLSTAMGLFAELNHAWVTIDNALYLWDYTNPTPDIIGFEEQSNNINAVKMVKPRKGVFVKSITHLLVVATTAEIILLGVETSVSPASVRTISLYQTRMTLSIRGIEIKYIEGSASTGRIFFAGQGDNDIYEITYQQEDKWFTSRCSKICHTSEGVLSLMPALPTFGPRAVKEHIVDMVLDDSRKLLYTLSSESTIRSYYLENPTTLKKAIEKKQAECLRDMSHMISSTPLLNSGMKIISISTISAKEGSKLHLMATTSTGCRLFLSATRGYGYAVTQGAPSSMQVQHIKFPPPMVANPPGQQLTGADRPIQVASQALCYSRIGQRYPPGFFLDLIKKENSPGKDFLFLSAPDTARISHESRSLSAQASRYYEVGCWIDMGKDSVAVAVGLVTKSFAAGNQPLGFGNELALQYDEPVTEIAILANTGVHVIRRRRLVDIFASAIGSGGNEEGFENEVKKFIRQYGRGETTATALAVACGQGNDAAPTAPDLRVARINDPKTLELARKCFVEFGGRPTMNENSVPENLTQALENVRPSSRHEGLALYMGRLVRSLWKSSVISQKQVEPPNSGFLIQPTIEISKLQSVQEDLIKLQTFLDKNKSFIEGLAGPDSLQRASSQQEEVALQGEHQALFSLQKLNSSIIEGISFVQMLFDERVDEIWTTLDDMVRQKFRELTYELLFSTEQGKDLAKVLVKAIVNRNIANGSNVDTVAEALRRRCGSFCSADDVIIFKAQELLKKASEVGATTDLGRNHLNESLRLFHQVAAALSFENLQVAAEQFTRLQFYAGAINLVLHVANEHDRGNKALAWVAENKPADDPRADLYEFRKECYDVVHQILSIVDQVTSEQPEYIDGKLTTVAQKRLEAYDQVNACEDELFQFNLYDWYLSQGWTDKLISIQSPHVITFLSRESSQNVNRADLLWRYYVHQQDFYNAAIVQHELAQSQFQIPLAARINLLSRAKGNANTQSGNTGRQQRQVLLHSVSELLEVANIQDEILHRLRGEDRIAPDRKADAIDQLDDQILPINVLYNEYADAAQYYDICLIIFECANHRNEADINSTWQYYLDYTHSKVADDPTNTTQQPYEAVINMLRDMSQRLKNSEATFSPLTLIPMIENYALEQQFGVGPPTWIPDLFIQVGFPFETILSTLQIMYLGDIAPFTGRYKHVLADHMVYVCDMWYKDCMRANSRLFGSEENAAGIVEVLEMLQGNAPNQQDAARIENLTNKIIRTYQ